MLINDGKVILCRSVFGKWKNPRTQNCEKVEKFTWKTVNRLEVSVMTLGATLLEVKAPDREGKVENILMGFDNLEDYLKYENYFIGSTVGPVAGVIKNGEFCLNGKFHRAEKNFENEHCINSGDEGLHKANWLPFIDGHGTELVLSHLSEASSGFPGTVLIQIIMTVNPNNTLVIKTTARSNQVTPIDISSKLFFNLASNCAEKNKLLDHLVVINASKVCEKKSDGIFKKTSTDVVETAVDLRSLKKIGDVIENLNGSIDSIFLIKKDSNETSVFSDTLQFASRLVHPQSGRVLEIQTNQPTIHFSTYDDFPCAGKPDQDQTKTTIIEKSLEQSSIQRNVQELQEISEDNVSQEEAEVLTLEHLRTKLTEREIKFFKCRVDSNSAKLNTEKAFDEKSSLKCLEEVPIEVSENLTSESVDDKKNSQNSGFSFSCQNFPNAVNHQRRYPDIALKPGQVYENNLKLKFGIHVSKNPQQNSIESFDSDVYYFPINPTSINNDFPTRKYFDHNLKHLQ